MPKAETKKSYIRFAGNVKVEWSCGHFGLFARGDKLPSNVCPWCQVVRGPVTVTQE